MSEKIHEFPICLGTKESLKDYGRLITPSEVQGSLGIPFYTETVLEGENIDGIKFNGPVVFRTSKIIPSRDYGRHTELLWLERHLRMTQGFVALGDSPFLLILGKPTPQGRLPDMSNVRAFVIPPGHTIFLHLGTWHDFPIAIKPFEITFLLLNSREVVEALASMEKPDEMDFGDAYKLRLSNYFGSDKKFVVNNFDAQKICFDQIVAPMSARFDAARREYLQDVRARGSPAQARNSSTSSANSADFGTTPISSKNAVSAREEALTPEDKKNYDKYAFYYGRDLVRKELRVARLDRTLSHLEQLDRSSSSAPPARLPVFVCPVINVELFVRGKGGPSIQSHLNSNKPELANSGWRDYGNRAGCFRMAGLFEELQMKGTVVMNSDLIGSEPDVVACIKDMQRKQLWEVAAHGINNTKVSNHASMNFEEERQLVRTCLDDIKKEFALENGVQTWLTPGFAVTENTTRVLMELGVGCVLDYVNDDAAFVVADVKGRGEIVALPYSLETNDISLCLGKSYTEEQYAQTLRAQIMEMAENSRNDRVNVLCLGLHTFIAGVPARVAALRKVLKEMKQDRRVKFVTCQEVVKVCRESASVVARLKSAM